MSFVKFSKAHFKIGKKRIAHEGLKGNIRDDSERADNPSPLGRSVSGESTER